MQHAYAPPAKLAAPPFPSEPAVVMRLSSLLAKSVVHSFFKLALCSEAMAVRVHHLGGACFVIDPENMLLEAC